MAAKKAKIRIVQLDNNGKVKVKEHPKDFAETIRAQVEHCLPKMVPGESQTLRKICGEEFWKDQVDGEEVFAGGCMSRLVRDKRLPLIQVGKDRNNAALYSLK